MSGQVILFDEQRYSVSDETKEKLLKTKVKHLLFRIKGMAKSRAFRKVIL